MCTKAAHRMLVKLTPGVNPIGRRNFALKRLKWFQIGSLLQPKFYFKIKGFQ